MNKGNLLFLTVFLTFFCIFSLDAMQGQPAGQQQQQDLAARVSALEMRVSAAEIVIQDLLARVDHLQGNGASGEVQIVEPTERDWDAFCGFEPGSYPPRLELFGCDS